MNPTRSSRNVVVAGASGFIGRALIPTLLARHRVVALGRGSRPGSNVPSGPSAAGRGGFESRRCDLLSLLDAERGVAGADVGVYLVHSMLPTARLSQAGFEDVDLIAADNFARAARKAGLSRIVYLGGLTPAGEASRLSPHLRSRLEVEEALRSSGVPTTVVRAGLVLGAGGSSFEMLVRLVDRLPALVCPAWTATPTQPVALADVVRVLAAEVDAARDDADPGPAGRVVEVGCPEPTTYRALMEETARALGRRRWFVSVPLFSPRLSRLWVRTVTGAPRELVDPLVESLAHPMVARDLSEQERLAGPPTPLRRALQAAVAGRRGGAESALERMRRGSPARPGAAEAPTVTSIQRLPLPTGWTASDVALEFGSWLPRGFRPFLTVDVAERRGEGGGVETVVRFRARLVGEPLLVLALAPERSAADRTLFRVKGGALARRPATGLLEFRVAPSGGAVLAAIRDFSPRLPWLVYRATQAPIHLAVMRAFGRHLGLVRSRGAEGRRGSFPGAEPVRDLLQDGPLLG